MTKERRRNTKGQYLSQKDAEIVTIGEAIQEWQRAMDVHHEVSEAQMNALVQANEERNMMLSGDIEERKDSEILMFKILIAFGIAAFIFLMMAGGLYLLARAW